jgi:hypothetical protein
MNFLKKGPDLKLSEIRVPGFLTDVYYDLKDRHLLPLVVILLVALVAVPIALSESSEPEVVFPVEASLESEASAGGGAEALVAQSAPGLRDYRRRLEHLQAKNPFKQQYANPVGESTGESASAESGSSAAAESAPYQPPTEPSSEPTEEGNPGPGGLRYYSYAIDVKVSGGGSQEDKGEKAKATERHNLPELTMLPSRKTPALVYMGSTRDGKKALMLVSSDVDSIFGDAKCVLGSETCELLAMEPGLPETIVYGGSGRTYHVELLKIHLVETKKLNRAPLGESDKQQSHPQPHPHGAS